MNKQWTVENSVVTILFLGAIIYWVGVENVLTAIGAGALFAGTVYVVGHLIEAMYTNYTHRGSSNRHSSV